MDDTLRQIRVLASETGVDQFDTRKPAAATTPDERDRIERFGRVVAFLLKLHAGEPEPSCPCPPPAEPPA